MRLGCEGESAIQPQFFVDPKELTIARWRMVFKTGLGFSPGDKNDPRNHTKLHDQSISGSCISWIVLSPKSKDD